MAAGSLTSGNRRVAVVGAGVSGLVCAQTLSSAGWDLRVFDKGREVGGRMSTRVQRDGLAFDHGAQYFTVRDERFGQVVEDWIRRGLAAPWEGRITSLGGERGSPPERRRIVGTPGMNSPCLQLARDLPIGREVRVESIDRDDGTWTVTDASGEAYGPFDWVVLAMPPAQAAALAPPQSELTQRAAAVKMRPCWAVLASAAAPLDVDFDAAFVEESPLSWIARTSSKPEREHEPERWVLHASAEWTEAHLEDDAVEVQAALLAAFEAVTERTLKMGAAVAHRWRYAIPEEPLPDECLIDEELQLGACGDWCAGPRVEGAFLSGSALARRVLDRAKA